MNINEFYKKKQPQIIKDIVEFVNIPSIYDEESIVEGKPFGENVDNGLNWILNKAKEMGMNVVNFDGFAGEITVGTGSKMIGILAHEDVVKAGEGWETNPFDSHILDGKIYGRGTADDKGPIISCLYVMHYLKKYDLIPDECSIRMIVGTNEEEEWKGIEYYTSHVDSLPKYSIVPDGYFPLVCCEKGLIDFNMKYEVKCDDAADIEIVELSGGVGRNIVPSKAICVLKCKFEEDMKFVEETIMSSLAKTIKMDGSKIMIEVTGKSTHAMAPENGVNAISTLMQLLDTIKDKLSLEKFVETYNRYIGMDFNGKRFGCDFRDKLSGETTFNVGTIQYDGDNILMECNLRYPASMKRETIKDAMLQTMGKAKFEYENEVFLNPIYIEPNSVVIEALMSSYQKITGDIEAKPLSIGGATYARAIPGAVAFGPLFPYETELAHEPNEFLLIESLKKMTEIFADGLISLMNLATKE